VADDLFDAPDMPTERPITASYTTECAYGDTIDVGDQILSDGMGDWAHVECIDQDEPTRAPSPCPHCFLVHGKAQVTCDG